MAVILFTDRCFKWDWFLSNLKDFTNLIWCHIHTLSNLLRCWVLSQLLQEVTLLTYQFIDGFNHVNWDTDRTCLVCDGTCNCLTNPPCRISWKLETFWVVKFINGFHKPHVTLLNQVQELHATSDIAFSDWDYQTKVGFCQTLFSFQITIFNSDSQFFFLFVTQEGHYPNLFEVHTNRVIDFSWVWTKKLLVCKLFWFWCLNNIFRWRISIFISNRDTTICQTFQKVINPISI